MEERGYFSFFLFCFGDRTEAKDAIERIRESVLGPAQEAFFFRCLRKTSEGGVSGKAEQALLVRYWDTKGWNLEYVRSKAGIFFGLRLGATKKMSLVRAGGEKSRRAIERKKDAVGLVFLLFFRSERKGGRFCGGGRRQSYLPPGFKKTNSSQLLRRRPHSPSLSPVS